ncbi:hypothetical protein F4775DRAFT_556894 [Biscogniauxia sp. FL1348]|nr:hypothetical protein F4775DRAFT_556894 [Biscogniauxia sp. FL1348]
MSSPQLAIAKVSFSAVLLRPDPSSSSSSSSSCTRNEIDEFLALVDATISRCSPPNVQKTKQWIVSNLAASPARIAALAKYLTALANSFSADITASRQAREPSSKRKRLHILYILNDLLYHVHTRQKTPGFAVQLEATISDIVRSAAAFANYPKHANKIQELLKIWDENGYFSPDFISKLRTIAQEAPKSQDATAKANGTANGSTATAVKPSRDAPFIMPAMHGDETVAWYDLPAANWLPVIEPNSTRPMNPDMIRPLQFAAGPADKQLVKAVQDLLADVDRIYAKDYGAGDDAMVDIDQLGQRVVLDEITGDIISGETYYGWSRGFCDKMKQRRKKGRLGTDQRGRSLSRSHSRSSSLSSSRPAFKRRRMSGSRSSSRSRSPSHRRNYSREQRGRVPYSSSRSPSPSRDRDYDRSRSRPGGGRSPLPPPPPPPQQSRPYDARYGNPPNGRQQGFPNPPGPLNPQFQQAGFIPPPFPPPPELGQFPVPPPPPPNYQGQWPPPPPPPIGGMPPNWLPNMPPPMGGWAGSPPPPPLPPPPQHQYPPQQGGGGGGGGGGFQYGRGGRGEFRGRGGWNRGRGGW